MDHKSIEIDSYSRLLRSGDKSFLRGLYGAVLPKVRSWVSNNSGTINDANDLFHQALETLIISASQNRLNVNGDIEPYIFKMCKYKWIDQLRKKDKLAQIDINTQEEQLRQEAQEFELLDMNKSLKFALDATYDQLSETCQKIVKLVKASTNVEHMVKQLKMSSANTLYRRKFACMKRWRELLLLNESYLNYKSYYEA